MPFKVKDEIDIAVKLHQEGRKVMSKGRKSIPRLIVCVSKKKSTRGRRILYVALQ